MPANVGLIDQHLVVAEIFLSFLLHLLPASVVGRKDQQRLVPDEVGNGKNSNPGFDFSRIVVMNWRHHARQCWSYDQH